MASCTSSSAGKVPSAAAEGAPPAPPDGRAGSDSGSRTLLLLSPNTELRKTQARLSFLRQQSSKPPSAWQLLL